MTTKTLKAKIKKYKELKAQIDEIEVIKKSIQAQIIEEFANNELQKLDGLQLVTFTKEYMTKKDTPADIWDLYKKETSVNQLRSCKA